MAHLSALPDECGAAFADDTRRLGPHETRVVVRLRRDDGDDDAPWITEIVVFCFNAQGDVLRIRRADDRVHDDDTIALRSFPSKEAVEKARATLSLSRLDASVEVVGVVVTYTTDEIAKRPHLNAFAVTCDGLAEVDEEDEDDPLLRVSSSLRREAAPPHVLSFTHDRPTESSANYVVLCKIYRDTDSRQDWIFHSIGAKGEVRSSVNSALAEAMQVFLLDIIPEIEIAHRNALNTVASICAALSRAEVLEMETYFRDDGVSREEFTKLMLLVLIQTRPELQRLSRVTSLVALLFEMFEQIDINGDGAVDWEEFTTFCVSIGLIATHDQALGSTESTRYTYHQHLVGPYNRSFPYQINCIRPLPLLHLVAVVQNKCSDVLMYDTEMNFLYEFTHVSRLCHEDNEALAILDIDYIQYRNWLVVSSTDHLLTFWSVVNATSGAYVYAFKIGSRCPIPRIQWCGSALNRLFTVSSEGMQLWDIEAKRVASRMNHHRDRITACVEIQADTPLLATCSFDGTIAVLHVPSLTEAFELVGHVQGIQHMDYNRRCGLLLSAGFEHEAYCWSIPGQCLRTTLGGHQASLIGARFVSHVANTAPVMVVVGDERGHFRLWDVTRCHGGHSIDLATALQSFDMVTPNLCKFHTFACVPPPQGRKTAGENDELFDLVSGSFHLYRFRAITHCDESAPPRHVTFNSVSNSFVGSVDGVITVWSGNTGSRLEEPVTIRNCEVCAIAFDMPRQRKLFVATSDGDIRLYNPITAMMLARTEVHDGSITSLIFCSRSSCLISTGNDRRISVAYSSAGKTDIDVLRSVENAHNSCIATAAYSSNLELIATGDDAGNIHVYDFQRLYLLFRCEGHSDEIRALHFHHSAPALFSGDAAGAVFVWHVAVTDTTYQIQPVMQLSLTCSSIFLTESRPSSVSGTRSSRPSTALKEPAVIVPSAVRSIVSTPESKHANTAYVYVGTTNGAIWGWDFRALTNHARKFGVGHVFEYRFHEVHPTSDTGSKYNALLRVTHKTSVLKLHPDDLAPLFAADLERSNKVDVRGVGSSVLQSGEASCVWQAHSSVVNQIQVLPYPGQIYSVSLDGAIKLWDASHTCIGTITVMPDHKQPKVSDAKIPDTPVGSALSSSWKFAHHHHTAGNSRDHHVRLAREMLLRVKRKIRKEERRRRGSGSSQDMNQLCEEPTEEPELATKTTETPPLPRALAAAEKRLARQIPFSKESRRLGMQTGLYSAEEARVLQELSRGPRKQHELQIKSRLAPLMLSSPKSEIRKKNAAPQGNEHELPVMRNMRHFPAELERRRATETRSTAHQAPLDTSLSPFLREKLSTTAQAKSTSKKRPPLSLKMEASVVVENVSFPLLRPDRSQPDIVSSSEPHSRAIDEQVTNADAFRRRLASYASAPCLSTSTTPTPNTPTHSALPSPSSPSIVSESVRDTFRVNIERKIRLYEDFGPPHGAANDDEKATDNRLPSRVPHRQQSQPEISVRFRADAESPSRVARKRFSQSTTSITNPYGPHYSIKQVVDFSGILARFDSDCSGDIDKVEWVHMMQNCRPIFGAADLEAAERLFHSIDRDDSGKISLHEILPMVFSKATPEQLQRMRQSIRARIDAAAAAMAAKS